MRIEKLAELGAEHLRHRLACGLRRTAQRGTCAEAPGELGHEVTPLDRQALGAPDVCKLLGLLELRSQVLEPCAVRAASLVVGSVLEQPAGPDRELVGRAR